MEGKKNRSDLIREQPVAYDEYAELPDDGNRYELVDGRLELMSPGASPKHQIIGSAVLASLTASCGDDYLIFYEVDIILSSYHVRRPDIVMVHRDRNGIITKRGVEGPTDLVAEIVSVHSLRRDKVDKLRAYSAFGIPEYWIILPGSGMLEQYELGHAGIYELKDVYSGDEPVRSERLPCVKLTVNDALRDARLLPNEDEGV
ncbi:Uma2 family endonuclease [Paenibacillus hamazuiensis]|uniref:Uma2 family endonuclease n=1 Tax=Paenibacillus hamazuiensis TaxID=2936508 RepID=UPI00200F89E3|nr:Uma2 family endonuclease [Paenibacillus hamazuiensis]